MAQNNLTHRGTMTGYQAVGDEVRGDARQPRAASYSVSPSLSMPFRPPGPPGNQPPAATSQKRQERPELPEDESPGEDDGWHYTATVEAPGPAYGGYQPGLPTGRYRMADAITTDARPAIESGAGKVIPGVAEDVL